MTMLFRHLRLYNLQTLRIKLRQTDTEDLEGGKQWLALQRALERMQFPQLKTVNIEIAFVVYESQDLNASAVAFTRSVVNLELVFHYEFLATPSIPQFVLLDDELHGDYAASREEMVACVERLKLANPTIRSVPSRNRWSTRRNPASSDDSTDSVAGISIKADEVAYHLCDEAVQTLLDALWDHVQDQPDISAQFEEFGVQMQVASASEPESDA
ncbi:hypothetical protein QFC20_005590 [Naganishia adeliensis]|uniref:Uncharacterized protein n=1 Tax=Naganishia adeliensis TaxID=92952 RepID=A0ACC2VK86_9TREE|nr:hypothetical protein QFC20_005590 [Naganishia adeliensis]